MIQELAYFLQIILFIKNASSSISQKKIYGTGIFIKIYMNANIEKKQIFHRIEYDFKDNIFI